MNKPHLKSSFAFTCTRAFSEGSLSTLKHASHDGKHLTIRNKDRSPREQKLLLDALQVVSFSYVLELLYQESKEPPAEKEANRLFNSAAQALSVMEASSFLACERIIKLCCDYLNAAYWPQEEVEKYREAIEELGETIADRLRDKLEIRREAVVSESLFRSLLQMAVSEAVASRKQGTPQLGKSCKRAWKLIDRHAAIDWKGLSEKVLKRLWFEEFRRLTAKLKETGPKAGSVTEDALELKLQRTECLLSYILRYDVCKEQFVRAWAETPLPRLTAGCFYSGDLGSRGDDDWVKKPGALPVLKNMTSTLSRILSSNFETIGSGSCAIEQATLANFLMSWVMVFVALENVHQSLHTAGKLETNEDVCLETEGIQRLLGSAKVLFASLDVASRDQCRFFWADKSRDIRTKMPWSTFVDEAITDFSATQYPVRLLECHLSSWRPSDPLPIDKFLKAAPHLTLELSRMWLTKFSYQHATSCVSSMRCFIEANTLIFEAALNPDYPTQDDVRFDFLEVWFEEYVSLDKKKAVDPRLAEALKKLLLSLPVADQAALVEDFWGKFYGSSSFDSFLDDWYIRTA